MKKYRLMILGAVLLGSFVEGADGDENSQSFRDWLNSQKHIVTIKDLGGKLSINGCASVGMTATSLKNETTKKEQSPTAIFDLGVDYRMEDKAWITSLLKFSDKCGLLSPCFGSGTDNAIGLEKIYIGYRLIDTPGHTLDLEIGRKGKKSLFEATLQGASNFDGIIIKDSYKSNTCGDFSYQLAGSVLDAVKQRYAYGFEIVFENVGNTGGYVKYSLINWDTIERKSIKKILEEKVPDTNVQFAFLNSQVVLGYKFNDPYCNKLCHIYALGVVNHNAEGNILTHDRKENYAACVGFSIGKRKNAGDWIFDVKGQMVQAQAISDLDHSGIGLGSKAKGTFYGSWEKKNDKDTFTNRTSIGTDTLGNLNYIGYTVGLQYFIKDNLKISQTFTQSKPLKTDLGNNTRRLSYSLGFGYSF